MSNDVRNVLHDAASRPSTAADVAGAWRRGRRLRIQRRVVSGVALVAVVGLGSLAIGALTPKRAGEVPSGNIPPPAPPWACATPRPGVPVPSWARDAVGTAGPIPKLASPDGNVFVVVFGAPLRAGTPTDPSNKILWIVRQARDGQPLEITATLPGSSTPAVHVSEPAGSSPGEIYPSIVDVSRQGCWHFALAWNGHRSAINLAYGPKPAPQTTTSTTSPTSPTTVPRAGMARCATAQLTVTIGAPNGTAGHINFEIAFRNDAASPCVLNGFPGVSFLDAAGHQTGDPAARNRLTPTPVTIAPGASAYAHLAKNDLGNPPCAAAPATALRVYPPNERAYVDIPLGAGRVCGTSYIDPVLDHPLG
jgi:hypothetical protein